MEFKPTDNKNQSDKSPIGQKTTRTKNIHVLYYKSRKHGGVTRIARQLATYIYQKPGVNFIA